MDECKPLASDWTAVGSLLGNRIMRDDRSSGFHRLCDAVPSMQGQGLTLVHFSAQPLPFWSVCRSVQFVTSYVRYIYSTEGAQHVSHDVLTLS